MRRYFVISKTTWDGLNDLTKNEILNASSSNKVDDAKWELDQIYYKFKITAISEYVSKSFLYTKKELDEFEESGSFTEKVTEIARDSTGREIVSTAIVPKGWSYHAPSMSFKTGKYNSVDFTDKAGADMAGMQITPSLKMAQLELYDSYADYLIMNQSASESTATISILRFTPPYDYYVVSGSLNQTARPAENLKLYAMLAPFLPYIQGGSREFICCSNLRFKDNVVQDGKAPKFVPHVQFSAAPDLFTNTIEIAVTHPAGVNHEVEIEVGLYRA